MLSSDDFSEILKTATTELINELPEIVSAKVKLNINKIRPWVGACVKKIMLMNNNLLTFKSKAFFKLYPSCGIKSMTLNYANEEEDYIMSIKTHINKELYITTRDSREGTIYYYYLVDFILPLFVKNNYKAGVSISEDGQRQLYVML